MKALLFFPSLCVWNHFGGSCCSGETTANCRLFGKVHCCMALSWLCCWIDDELITYAGSSYISSCDVDRRIKMDSIYSKILFTCSAPERDSLGRFQTIASRFPFLLLCFPPGNWVVNGGPADPILSRGPLTERETLVICIFLIFYCVAGFAQDRLTSRQPTIEGPSVKWALHLIDIVDGLDCTGDASRSDNHQVELERDVSTANRLTLKVVTDVPPSSTFTRLPKKIKINSARVPFRVVDVVRHNRTLGLMSTWTFSFFISLILSLEAIGNLAGHLKLVIVSQVAY